MADKNRAEEEAFKSGGPEGHFPHHGVRAPKDTTHSSTRVQGLCKHGALQGNKDLLANIAGDPSVHMQGKHSRMEAQEVSEEQMQHIRAEAEQARREGRCGPHDPPAAQTMMHPVEGNITGGPISGHATYSTAGSFGQYNPLRNQTGTFGTSASMQDSNAPSTTVSHSVKPHCGGLGSVPGGGGVTGGSMH